MSAVPGRMRVVAEARRSAPAGHEAKNYRTVSRLRFSLILAER